MVKTIMTVIGNKFVQFFSVLNVIHVLKIGQINKNIYF